MCKHFFSMLAGVVLVTGSAIAQVPGERTDTVGQTLRQGNTVNQQNQQEQWAQFMQQNMARCLLLGNQEEVLLGQFASDRIQNPQVKEFAQMMVKDHNQMIAKLERFAPGSMTTNTLGKRVEMVRNEIKSGRETMPISADTGDNRRTTTTTETTTERSMTAQNPLQMIAGMQQQMVENRLAITQHELSQVEKDQFDKAYMAQQISAHVGMLAKLKTFEPYASTELKPIIQSAEKATREHLEHAKNICKQMESQSDTSSSSEDDSDSGNE